MFRAAILMWIIIGFGLGAWARSTWHEHADEVTPSTRYTVTPHISRYYYLSRTSINQDTPLIQSGPTGEMLIQYCLVQAESTAKFAIERDNGKTREQIMEEVETWVIERNTNDVSDDDISPTAAAVLIRSVLFAYSKPTWTASQIWDDFYRRCVDADIV